MSIKSDLRYIVTFWAKLLICMSTDGVTKRNQSKLALRFCVFGYKDILKLYKKYPFDEMSVGDSFVVPLDGKEKVRVACFNEGARKNKKFSLGMDEEGDIRCWRLK